MNREVLGNLRSHAGPRSPPHLMQLQAHSDSRSHHLLKQVQVSKNPLVLGSDAEVSFKQGVEPVQEGFQAWRQMEVRGLWKKRENGDKNRRVGDETMKQKRKNINYIKIKHQKLKIN